MGTLASEITNKKFKPNVVIRFPDLSEDFAVHQPDSGLTIAAGRRVVSNLTVNPTRVDLRRVNTTIASNTFDLIDKNEIITALFKDNSKLFLKERVQIFIGRIGVSMDFSEYFELPETIVNGVTHNDNRYTFRSVEQTDRMNKPVFNFRSILEVDILAGTTTIDANTDIDDFPASGIIKINDEFISYTSKDNGARQFLGATRGEKGSTPSAHDAGSEIFNVTDVSGNPVDLLLQILISGGGGGPYDVLSEGLGIDESLIDVTEMENIRDQIFAGESYSYSLYGFENMLKDFIEPELLDSINARFKISANSKISIAILDQTVFGEAPESISEDTQIRTPRYTVQDRRLVNKVIIDWDFLEGTQRYREQTTFIDQDSIDEFGEQAPLRKKWKGPKAASSGQLIVNDRGGRLIERFKTPTPDISVDTQMDKGLLNIGDKILLASSKIPSASGTLQFASEVEILEKSINWINGDVKFKLAFTSYTGIRGAYIAPSDNIVSITSQKVVDVGSGRGDCYEVGWKLQLWNNSTEAYEADAPNEIVSISGDQITFKDNFSTTLVAGGVHRLKFPEYDDASADQRRFAFISDDGNDFDDGSATYRITF